MRQLIRSNTLIITLLVVMVFFVFFCMSAHCQSDTVSATVVDQSSTTWANGTWKLQFVPNPNSNTNNVFWNGNLFPVASWLVQGSLNGSGQFSNSTPRNDFINPAGSTWTLTVCPNATSACTVITGLSFTSTSSNLSSTITAASPAPKVIPLPFGRAYNDAEVTPNPSNVGYFYMNVSQGATGSPRFWGQDQAFHSFNSGVSSFTAGNLPPLFTTSTGGDPANPDLTFTLSNAAANKVFGNCTTSTAPPSYCSLTPAMIPSLPYLPSSTTLFYQTMASSGTLQNQRLTLNFTGKFILGDNASPSETDVDLANVPGLTAGTYHCPATIIVNAQGQVTSVTTGTCPVTPPKTAVAAVNFTTCSMVSAGTTDQNCVATQAWGTTITGPYSISCIIGVPFTGPSGTADTSGLTQTTWGLSGASPLGTTSFNYYLANQHLAAVGGAVTMSCVAVQ
jgi:hypothetical protein